MHILVISDAWLPQVNGVVRTYQHLGDQLQKMGHRMEVIGPADFKFTIPTPGYSEIRLAVFSFFTLPGLMKPKLKPGTHVHIATEGPLGKAARHYCLKNKIEFSTCYHTEFPDYIAKRVGKYLPFLYTPVRNLAIASIRKFHSKAKVLFVATDSLEKKLKSQNYTVPIARLTRGVNFDIFHPGEKIYYQDLKKPVAICVARVAIEKNLEAFFDVPWEGSKVMVGHGPDLEMLKQKYPDVIFSGKKEGQELGAHYRSADMFVFPSKTDTFGMVLIEALASGLPIAAYPVTGPVDIVTFPQLGSLNEDLAIAMRETANARGTAQDRYDYTTKTYSWEVVANQFLSAIMR